MKKIISLAAVVLACAVLLCACSGGLDLTAEAEPLIQEMLTALSAGDLDAAEALLHPTMTDARGGLEEIADYLDGRSATRCVQNSLNFSSNFSTRGSVKTESGTLQVTLEDGSVLQLTYTYESNSDGSGFTSFSVRFTLGV